MTEEVQNWTLGGDDPDKLPIEVKALAEHFLTETGGEPLQALIVACCAIGQLRSAVSICMMRSGVASDAAKALDILARSHQASRAEKHVQ